MAVSGSTGLKCHLKTCSTNLTDKDGRIEVCTVLPQGFKSRKNFHVLWKKNGEAKFHTQCWSQLTKAARSQGGTKKKRQKQKDTVYRIELSSAERSMVKEAMKTAEHHDSYDTVREEAERIAHMIRNSSHCVAFTGAGISTSAGIGDYRGKSGKWTEMDRDGVVIDSPEDEEKEESLPSPAKRARFSRSLSEASENEEGEEQGVDYDKLRPTYTHEALWKLVELGHLKHIISQNGDGLHGLSGWPLSASILLSSQMAPTVPRFIKGQSTKWNKNCPSEMFKWSPPKFRKGVPLDKLSELHGNVFQEKCEKCGKLYDRSFYVMDDDASLYFEEMDEAGESSIVKPAHAVQCDLCGLSHRTGRKCGKQGCKGHLKDTIINFRDHLEDGILDRATEESRRCDLFLCLGTTLLVTPAADLVDNMREPQTYVVCNRQKTHLDKECTKIDKITKQPMGSRVFGDCDLLMREVMKCILSQKDLRAWEEGRTDRMKVYDNKRNDS